jgi:hypothetical protein
MQEMIAKLFESMEKLRQTIDKRYEISEKRAHAEYCYRETLGREMAMAKAEGMAATALYPYCKGLENVAKLREERDILIAQEEYLTELVFFYRTSIKVYGDQAEAERKVL